MDRTERLLDLVALLLDSHEPVSFSRVRELFPDYGEGSAEANERKFERDKAELAELGIPLRYVQGDEDSQSGYLIDRDAYYLPELPLRAEEWAVLYAAGSAVLSSGLFPGSRDLSHALRKIAFARGAEPVPQFTDALRIAPQVGTGSARVREWLDGLWDAVKLRKRVTLTYKSFGQETTQRDVDPYGIALRRGVWILVGYCHLRKGLRTFNVERILDLAVNQKKPKSADFEVPADFKLIAFAQEQSWEHRFHDAVEVQLRLDPSLAPLAARLFPHAKVAEEGTDVRVRATHTDELVRQVLALGTRVEIAGPPEVRARAKALLGDLQRDLSSVEALR
jgi:proteasome accessory factor B